VNDQPIEVGVKFRANVPGEISGIRFYKLNGNTGTHTGSLWSSDGQLLATATFKNETATGWQQVYFDNPVIITPGTTYIASYFAPNGRYAYTPNALVGKRISNSTGSLTALKASDGGNGMFKTGGGFPSEVSSDNGNFYVDVVFNNTTFTTNFALNGIISSNGCAVNNTAMQSVQAKLRTFFDNVVQKQDLQCGEGSTGIIKLTAYGCNSPYQYSINDGANYQTTGTFTNLPAGSYKVRIKDAVNYIWDTTVVIGVDKAVWTGALSTEWHNPANWSTNKVPTSTTHVIIPATQNECVVSDSDITVASLQVKAGAVFRMVNNRKSRVINRCAILP
jgi:hypothetical protein